MAPASVLFGVIATFASGALASCAHGTFLQPRAEGEIKAPTFGYAGSIGPANWVSIDAAANQACASGTRQSPIDMTSDVFTMVPGSELAIEIPDLEAGAEFENLGTTVEIIAEGGTIKVSDTTYTLQQFHFHLPSEHLDNGTSRAMEMHMVWQSEAEELAVIGVYVDIAGAAAAAKAKGRRRSKAKGVTTKATTASTLLETVLGTVDKIPTLGNTVTTEPLVMSELVTALSAGSFKAYSGSLTTPPCSEGVHWFVSTEVLTIESATFFKARDVIGYNARYAQNAPGEPNLVTLAAASMA